MILRLKLGQSLFFLAMAALALSFLHAAVQGPFGLLKRIQIEAETSENITERDSLQREVNRMRNLTRRLSDHYLDLDLLDERARHVLGLMRPDEVIIPDRIRPVADDSRHKSDPAKRPDILDLGQS